MKPDLSKLSGEELFDYYTSKGGDYSQILFLAHLEISDRLFDKLKEAEKLGRKIAIKESISDIDDPPINVYIE